MARKKKHLAEDEDYVVERHGKTIIVYEKKDGRKRPAIAIDEKRRNNP